jgi:hypothetical protein
MVEVVLGNHFSTILAGGEFVSKDPKSEWRPVDAIGIALSICGCPPESDYKTINYRMIRNSLYTERKNM